MAKILAIDDEARMLELICSFLEHAEHQVQTATGGEPALALARTYLPDLILCDVQMPGMDGYAVLRAFREDAQLSRIPFVFLTGLDDMKHLRQGMNLGADDYLTKPFTYVDLSTAIQVRLEKQKAVAEVYEAELREVEAKTTEALYTDEVSGLPNRKRLQELFPLKSGELASLVLLSCAFDGFQDWSQLRPEALINILLKGASTRLRSQFQTPDELFYLERNHFVVLMDGADPTLSLRCQTMLSKLNDPFKIMQQEFFLTASVGIARCPENGLDLNSLLRQAEAARHKAEQAGGNQHHFVD